MWIPRFAYSIPTGYHGSVSKPIDVIFLNGLTNTSNDLTNVVAYSNGNTDSNYVLHPAFQFGGTELHGIWVAKFEASNSGNKVKITPNVTSWREATVGTMFNASRAMETDTIYGWAADGLDKDTHMTKNNEWGAVAYLSNSIYGSSQVWTNPNPNYITGYAGTTANAASETTTYTYDTSNGMKASTTGNVTGVYDMAGGAYEYVMSNMNSTNGSSGLSVATIDSKYIQIYSNTNNGGYNNSTNGDAFYETSYDAGIWNGSYFAGDTTGSWNFDLSVVPNVDNPWFVRGAGVADGVNAGIFAFSQDYGGEGWGRSFRPILLVETGL